MYYLIKGILHDSEDMEIIEGTFEWAVTSEEDKEKALADLSAYEEVTEIKEITLEECIEHEKKLCVAMCAKIIRCVDVWIWRRMYILKRKRN